MAIFSITYPFEIGQKGPSFKDLPGVDGKKYSLSDFDNSQIIVLIFMANRCPTARVYTERMKAIQNEYNVRGVQLIGVNSDNQYFYSLEGIEKMAEVSGERELNFPYLKDFDQTLAKGYGALVTLHAFVLDRERKLRYRGRIDDSRDPSKVTASDLRNALEDLISGRKVRTPETRPFACSIEFF